MFVDCKTLVKPLTSFVAAPLKSPTFVQVTPELEDLKTSPEGSIIKKSSLESAIIVNPS